MAENVAKKSCKVGTDVSVCWVKLCVCVLIGASSRRGRGDSAVRLGHCVIGVVVASSLPKT